MIPNPLNVDRLEPVGDGLDFDASNETWIIDPGVLVFSLERNGVDSNGLANDRLINQGKTAGHSAWWRAASRTSDGVAP